MAKESNGAIFRVQKNSNYTVMSNYHLNDERLSYKAMGILSRILSLPPDWNYSLAGLATKVRDSIYSVRSGINELEDCGYITRRQTRTPDGKLGPSEYLVYENPNDNPAYHPSEDEKNGENRTFSPSCGFPTTVNPTTGNPISGKPTTEKPISGNQTQINTKRTKYARTNYSINPSADEQQLTMDGSMDLSIGEVLREIGYQSSYLYQLSDDELIQEITAEPLDHGCSLKQCRIPQAFTTNPKAMETAIRLLSCCDYYRQDDLQLSLSICNTLAAMATTAKATYNGSTVNAVQVLDKINEMLQTDGDLAEMLDNFIDVWHKIMRERHGSIKNLSAYMKSCLWTWMNVSKLEFESALLSIS